MFEEARARGIYILRRYCTPERDHNGMGIEELMSVLADVGVAEEFEV